MTHILALLFISFIVAIAFATLIKETTRDRIIFGIKMFLGLIGFAIIAGWIGYFLP